MATKQQEIKQTLAKKSTTTKPSFFQTWKEVMFNPNSFFEKLSQKDGYRSANKFFLGIQAITLALSLIIFVPIMLFLGLFSSLDPSLGASLSVGFFFLIMLLAFPFILIFSWGMLYFGAGIVHLFARLLGAKNPYIETFKANAYAIAPNIFSFIPFVGYAAGIYSLILLVIGLHKRQGLSVGRAAATILIPMVLCLILFFLVLLVIFNLVIPASTVTY